MVQPATLTAKQQRFVDEYLIDLNATQAAIRAGYSEKTAQQMGSENLSKPVVADAIKARQIVRAEKAEMDEAWILDKLRANVDRGMQAEAVTDREGNETGLYTYQGSVVNKALELIGKHRGMFVERTETKHSGSVGLTVRIVREGRRITAS